MERPADRREAHRPLEHRRAALPAPDKVLVEYAILAEQVLRVVLDASGQVVQLGGLDEVRQCADLVLFGLRRLTRPARTRDRLATRAAAPGSSHHPRPVSDAAGIADDQPIVVSPTTGLRRIPWSALHSAPAFVVPAASFWSRTSEPLRPWGGAARRGPDLAGAVGRSPSCAPCTSPGRPGTSGVHHQAVLPHLARADLAHIACHGLLRADNPPSPGSS